MPAIVWGIDPDVVNRVPLNGGVNHIRYSLNHEKKLATNCAEVGHLLKVVVLGYMLCVIPHLTAELIGGHWNIYDNISI
uniref:Uncharacterized protein n=1 Tax=Candidatus Methanogaster sp. ANME-2c ERB4 TaxID=2759911 RepID=A0A7G9Y2E7_9EURY|nr:hypothetical protein EHLBLFLE_00003 [Methanosarcinales archaeon ANME-2c ERB4]QNO42400.1 hypothetical protein LFOPHFOE_00040 [Methanosarcinales archaeon ANME-2c ERB4]